MAAATSAATTSSSHVGRARGEQHPGDVGGLLRAVDPGEERAEADRGEQREPDRGAAGPARLGVGDGASRAASTTPPHASTIPATCSAPGRSPDASPASTGIATPVAEIGATMLIVPIASAR